jgi:predicted ATPase
MATPDDFQWIDPASMDLLEMLLPDSKFGPGIGKYLSLYQCNLII